MRSGFDCADPGAVHIAGFDVAGGYIGGNTPHVWTPQQWDDQPARWRAPIWVLNAAASPVGQAQDAVTAMRHLGAPEGSAIILDMEATAAPAEVSAFADHVHAEHYCTIVYGSKSTLFANPTRVGYWVADPTGAAHLYEHPHTLGTQWGQRQIGTPGLTVDVSDWSDNAPLWDSRPPAPVTLPAWASTAMADLTAVIEDAGAVRTAIASNAR